MARLTLPHYGGDGHYMKCSESFGCDGNCGECDELDKIVDRLAYYEDMEEQGRLLVLENAEHRNAVMKFYDRLKTDGDWMVQALKGGAN